MSSANIHPTADVADSADIPSTSKIWHYAQVRESSVFGENCIVGRGAYIGTGVTLGDGCKIQNYALVYEPAVLEDGVFIGPAAVLTNDEFPRAVNSDLSPKSAHDWKPVGVHVKQGASIGANSTCIAPVTIGEWALVGSGSVVTQDVPNFALVVGNPARRIRWVGKAGMPLKQEGTSNLYICPVTGDVYREISPNELVEVSQ
ncbi:acyltransferase [Aurantimicrobium minutum]|uniref:acyltransferase n=1 Tax=Aurantimicrobium minutum TaxID=708131 RepID=UPI002473346E|nr:acyltransferase [Aurantimicrobium minutum]MDH6255405.1 UDP-2-acetamido-3-amino-2,3-dideoxy-glucuronate N-acetyltransferase [Aurantimicrobium minutum]